MKSLRGSGPATGSLQYFPPLGWILGVKVPQQRKVSSYGVWSVLELSTSQVYTTLEILKHKVHSDRSL